jgi:exodeoxyribonuclease-3
LLNRRARAVYPVDPKRYQVQQAVSYYVDILRERPSVMVGDFNNHVCWDKPGKPSNMRNAVRLRAERGFASAYHTALGVDFGDEPEPTHYLQTRTEDGRTYHIDYCFVPTTASATVSLGSFADWVGSGQSDHVPLIVDVLV